MSKVYNEDVHFAKGLSIGNFAHGMVVFAPSPREMMSVDVTGLNMEGTGEMYPQVQVFSQWPWHSCSNAAILSASEEEPQVPLWDQDATGFRIVFRRTNSAITNVGWCVWKAPE